MRLKGNGTGRVLMFVAAAALCVGGGVAAGRLPVLGLIAKAAPAQVAHSGQKATAQGITVHGWWTIKVFSGSRLVREKQFENALTTDSNGGSAALTALLAGHYTTGPWGVVVRSTSDTYYLYSAGGPQDQSLAVNDVGHHTVLTGSFTSRGDISIASVGTLLYLCGRSSSPDSCSSQVAIRIFSFTNADVSPNLAVSSGQIVQVKVDISFS
jgi:hypothetical protein